MARISIERINRLIESLPMQPGQYMTKEWQADSYCSRVMKAALDRFESLTKEQRLDLDVCTKFICQKWPEMDERPRSSVYMTVAGMLDKFLYSPIRDKFCSGRFSFTPEDAAERGKIVLVDWPMLEIGHETGKFINCLTKLVFQRALLRRTIRADSKIAFIWADESQYFLLPRGRDNAFQQTCRSFRVASVYITQNVMQLADEMGEAQPGPKVKGWLANLGTKIFCQNNCPDTNTFAADLIGREIRTLGGMSVSSRDATVTRTEQVLHTVMPGTFTRLIKPTGKNSIAQAIVYRGGQPFRATCTDENPDGSNWISTGFPR